MVDRDNETAQRGEDKGILRRIKAGLDRSRLGDLLVMRGAITPQDLRHALSQQKKNGGVLGQVLIANSLITRRQLAFVLTRQYVLRVSATVMLLALSGFTPKRARADELPMPPVQAAADQNAYAQLAIEPAMTQPEAGAAVAVAQPAIGQSGVVIDVAAHGFAPLDNYPMLFGTSEKRSANLSAFTKWTGMFDRFQRQTQSAEGHAAYAQWNAAIQHFQGEPLKTMAEHVNDMMNEKPYIVDSRNWGVSDYWETPIEFMQKGGDCEDFAIAKYEALRALGVPEGRLRVAIVQDTQKNIPHAVAILYADDGVYVLDNQNKAMLSASSAGRYRPIFSINREAWWLHSAPDAQEIAAR